MTTLPGKAKPNRLLPSLILLSLGLHLLFLVHVAGRYHPRVPTYIELTVQDVAKPAGRAIPRPKRRHQVPKITGAKKFHIQHKQYPLPAVNPAPKDTTLPATIMEEIRPPDLPVPPDPESIAQCPATTTQFGTANDYFAMVRRKIERRKQYPASARSRHLEGRVTVRFVIKEDGGVTAVRIAKRGQHGILDRAALNAVKDAAPFPKPPSHLFQGPLYIEITIVFKLT